jgi:hypothetical protein
MTFDDSRFIPPDDFMNSLVSVTLTKPESFLYIREILTRTGIKAKLEPRLCQSCHILRKRDKYYIMHFKELFILDGKTANFSEHDLARRNTITSLLADWKLLKVDDPKKIESPRLPIAEISIIPYKEKMKWTLESKYQIGRQRS